MNGIELPDLHNVVPSMSVLGLLAILVVSSAVGANDCELERVAFARAGEAYLVGHLEAGELMGAADALRGCPGATHADIEKVYNWTTFLSLNRAVQDPSRRAEAGQEVLVELDAYRRGRPQDDMPAWYFERRGTALMHMRQFVDAIDMFRHALERGLPPERRVDVLRNLGGLLLMSGALEEAADLLRMAADEVADATDDPLQLAGSYRRYGEALVYLAQHQVRRDSALFARSEAYLQRAIDAYEGAQVTTARESVRDRLLSDTQQTLAQMRQAAGRDREALEAAERAVALAVNLDDASQFGALLILGSTLRANHRHAESLEALRRAEAFAGDRLVRQELLYTQMGHTLAAVGAIDRAEEYYRRSIELSSQAGTRFGASEWGAQVFNLSQRVHRRLVALLLEQGRNAEAFEVLDATRVRALRDMQRLASIEALQPEVRDDVERLQEERRRLRAELVRTDSGLVVQARLASVEAALMRIAVPPPEDEQVSIAELQARLAQEDRLLVAYFIAPESYAFVISADRFDVVALDVNEDELWTLIASLPSSDLPAEYRVAVELQPLRTLYESLFRPIEHLVQPGRRLTVILDGPLALVPFGMLVSSDGPRFRYESWPFLVRRNPITTELAAGFVGQRTETSARAPLVAFGRSTFSSDDEIPLAVAWPPPPLPYVRRELSAIRRQVPAGTYLLDRAARRGHLLGLMADARVVHIATHVFVSTEKPIFSSILLGSDGAGSDGALYLYDLIGRRIPTELVVLSACDSAQGRMRRGEGIAGLHYAFRAAGAAASVATLWAVDDEATAFLMARFYRYLARGEPKDVALQLAQIDFLDSREGLAASPFYWAGVMLSGDPGGVDLSGGRRAWIWLASGLGLVSGAVLFARRRRPL